MKGGVETGHLRYIRSRFAEGANRRQIMRLMQGRERNQFFQFADHLGSHSCRARKFQAAMHYAVSDRNQSMTFTVATQKFGNVCDGLLVSEPGAEVPLFLGDL